jgi:hypothetical protein
MARDDDRTTRSAGSAGNTSGNTSGSGRDKYRDNDDVRAPLAPDERSGVKSDSRSEARGDARENVGNTARGTAADPTGPEGNDNTRGRPAPDEFDDDLARDERRSRE